MGKRIIVIGSVAVVFVVVCIFAFSGCSKKKYHSELSDYGLWNKATDKILQKKFSDSLPTKSEVDKYGCDYYYKFSQGLLGDPNFVILVSLEFSDESIYQQVLSKYFSGSVCGSNSDLIYRQIQGSDEEIADYMDDKVLDGVSYNFEVVCARKDEQKIYFVNANVWDYYNDRELVEYLQGLK